jgi:hypothetical protein
MENMSNKKIFLIISAAPKLQNNIICMEGGKKVSWDPSYKKDI